jgi:hypothetical protein
MKRPVSLVVGLAAGAVLIAAVGASAHTGFSLIRTVGVQQSQFGDEASGARTESPVPAESPEASPEPTEKPEAPPTAEPSETPETDESGEPADTDTKSSPAPTTEGSDSGQHDGGGDHRESGD